MKQLIHLTLTIGLLATTANAQSLTPEIVMPSTGTSIIITRISDNGQWGISETGSVTDGDISPSGGVLFNMQTLQQTNISHYSGLSGVGDVTNDGQIVVGECAKQPAYWSAVTQSWTTLPLPTGYDKGRLNAVTPDGHFAVGYAALSSNGLVAHPVCYDLTTNTRLELPGLPVLDMTNEDQHQNCLFDISPDGRYIVGELSQSYMLPVALCSYVYDRETSSYKIIGFTENHTGKWIPKAPNLFFTTEPSMSPNGQWITGSAYIVEEIYGSEWPIEYYSSYRYNIANDEIEVFNGANESDMSGFSILNDGTVLAVSPAVNPYSSTMVRSGKYFIGLDQIFKQVYGMDYTAMTGFAVTGKPLAVSEDGLTMVMLPNTSDTYILRLKEPIQNAAARVNLLGNYSSFPAQGCIMSQLRTITLTFDREVEINGIYSKISFKSEDGSESWAPLQSNGFRADGKTITISFRTRTLTNGTNYTLNIPAGLIRLKGDAAVTNSEINLTYTGRENTPVTVVDAYPADNASVASLDLSTNPIILTFDADLALKDNAVAYLYRATEDEPYCQLIVLCSDKRLLLYPLSKQNLFSGTDYRVVIPANTVTDISGGGANEEYVLNYRGAYVREVSADDRYLFNEDCNNFDNFMFYEGDNLTPTAIPKGWGFTKDTTPWWIVRGSEDSQNMAMSSHSMYSPAGQADDWMVTAQLFIPDADCYLTFDAQSYLKSKNDSLKVYVYASSNVYNTLKKSIIDDIRANGTLVFSEQLSPGATEEGLDNEWTNYVIRLDQYAGKDIYIAFVNENTDQSAIFIDNIQVVHDLRYLITFENNQRVVNQENIIIRGNLTIATEIETYDSVSLTLKDANGVVIDTQSETGLQLKKGDVYRFEFSNPFPLKIGENNKFSLETTLASRTSIINSSVKNLAFEPFKRVVLEEYTGAECPNCPQGIVAIEHIQNLYPGQLIPIGLHTYQSDQLGTGIKSYSTFLGIEALGAPSAVINRHTYGYPMIRVESDYRFSGAGILNEQTGRDEETWLDLVSSELAQPAEADVQIESKYDATAKNINVTCQVRNALNCVDASINIFAVILENNLESYQSNGFASVNDPDFGEWSNGGIYASPLVYPCIKNDVARGTWGTTFNGTGGLLPSTLENGTIYNASFSVPLPAAVSNPENCQIVIMLIDAASGNVLNANIAPINGSSVGIKDVIASDNDDINITSVDGNITISSMSRAAANVYDFSGRLIASGNGDTDFTINLNGYTGLVIVNVTTSNGSTAAKKLTVR